MSIFGRKMAQSGERRKLSAIGRRLFLYNAMGILIFALTVGVAFTAIFTIKTRNIYVNELERNANSLATMLSKMVSENGELVISDEDAQPPKNDFHEGIYERGRGFRMTKDTLASFASSVTDSTIWIIARDGDSYSMLFMVNDESVQYFDTNFDSLSVKEQAFIENIYKGYVGNTADFRASFGEGTLSVGTPIVVNNRVVGVVLLHSSNKNVNQTYFTGIVIVAISILIALLISALFAELNASKLSKPIMKINETATDISNGDYKAKTNVESNDEIGTLAKTIDSMGDKLEQANIESERLQRARQTFVANVSHELRTPVTVMRGTLEAICDGVVTDPDKLNEYHSELLKESIYMQRLVNDILELSRLQNADFALTNQPFNICDCINDAVRSIRHLASDKGVTVDLTYDSSVAMINGDYDRVRQMLIIFLDNAVKFTQNTSNPVTISLKDNVIEITNIGVGISSDELPHIFERFYKSRNEANKSGTGLGLAIASQIASRHSMTISVTSVPDGETTFRIDISHAGLDGTNV